jgi:hypothetical protein
MLLRSGLKKLNHYSRRLRSFDFTLPIANLTYA